MSLLKQIGRSRQTKINNDLESELPFFIAIVTLMATSGFGPYTIFQKLSSFDLLPHLKKEANKMIKKIDILGIDPLTVMTEEKEKGPSKNLGDFLNGYVSAIQGGGDVISYLKNKMRSTFELYEHSQKEIVNKVRTLVETYMTVQIIVLAVYIIIIAVAGDSTSQGSDPTYMIIMLGPLTSAMFLLLAHKMNRIAAKEDWKKIIMFAAPGVAAAIILNSMKILPEFQAVILAIILIGTSIMPAIKYSKTYRFNIDAGSATTQIIRDVTETRKAGLGPEKCVVKATKRTDFGAFNRIANAIANKLEWGLSLEEIYNFIKSETHDFRVRINFRILFEIISSGGGNVKTLDTLAGVAEKMQNIEKEKIEMLKPYVMIGFMMVGITGFCTLFVVDSLGAIGGGALMDDAQKEVLKLQSKSRMELISITILIQSWMSGLFLGKVITGSFEGGFKYSIMLVAISLVGIVMVQQGLFNISALFE